MIRQEYIDFIEKFEGLNPYELDHLCKIFFQHYEVIVKSAGTTISDGDVREMMVQTIKEVHLDLAERKVESAKLNLAAVKLRYYEQS